MQRTSAWLALLAVSILSLAAHAQDEAVLEHYVLAAGSDIGGASGEVSAFIQDERFGGGSAEASVFYDTVPDARVLNLRVWRHVPPGTIVFALLVFRVEVRGFDASGQSVFSRDLPYFAFGDSAAGNWTRRLRLPRTAERVEVSYFGNYE